MKKFKRFASFILAVIMVLALGVTAFAAETNGKITIENPVEKQTYTIYRIFDLESYNQDTGAYSYKVNDKWGEWVKTQGAFVTVNDQGYVSWVEDADPVAFAKLALAHAKEASVAHDGTKPATTSDQPVVFDGLPLGYYLVDSSLGALCSLDTTNPEVAIKEKNTAPVIDKQVEEDSNRSWGKDNDADIGQTVNYKTIVRAKKGAENYVVHDKMSAGLTLNPNSIKVEGLTKDTDYTVNTSCEDGCTFEIIFKQEYLNTINADTDIVITYSAVLNKDAVIAEGVNTNDTKLSYGDKNETEWIQTETKTYRFQLVKTNGDKLVLDGAEFELYDVAEGGNKIALVDLGGGTYRVATEEEKASEGFTSAVIKAGQATIQGLDGGTDYYLEEIKAPDGYNKLHERVEVRIENSNLDATVNEGNIYENGGVQVINKTGSELPETGGMGTTVFYVLGSVLVVGAVVLLVTKKRMNNAE